MSLILEMTPNLRSRQPSEDFEFGFTIIMQEHTVKNTNIIIIYNNMQDLFERKVCQFHFEIQKMFGSSKPFSCDMVVRHADQITVLPIEGNVKC